MEYIIQTAKTDCERKAIYRFRYRVYIEEMKKFHILADHENKLLYDETDSYTVLYYSSINDNIVATLRSQRGIEGPFCLTDEDFFCIDEFTKVFDHKCLAINDRLIVDEQFRRSVLCHQMMVKTYVDGWKNGTRLCFITCDDQLLSMYLRYGFRIYKDPVTLPTGEKRNRLLLFLCDKKHLENVRSPFFMHLPNEMDDRGLYALKARKELNIELI